MSAPGLDLVVVQVRAREDNTRRGRYIAGTNPETGDPYILTSEPVDMTVRSDVLARWETDRWVEVKRFDARMSASKKMGDAIKADESAKAAEAVAANLRNIARAMIADAETAIEAIKDLPPEPAPAPAPTPYQDQLRAALPDAVRAAVDAQKLNMAVAREQIMQSSVQRATTPVDFKPDGALDAAFKQAIGQIKTGAPAPAPATKAKK